MQPQYPYATLAGDDLSKGAVSQHPQQSHANW